MEPPPEVAKVIVKIAEAFDHSADMFKALDERTRNLEDFAEHITQAIKELHKIVADLVELEKRRHHHGQTH